MAEVTGNRGIENSGGEGGIRTLDTGVSPYNGLANRRLQPLGHLSGVWRFILPLGSVRNPVRFSHGSPAGVYLLLGQSGPVGYPEIFPIPNWRHSSPHGERFDSADPAFLPQEADPRCSDRVSTHGNPDHAARPDASPFDRALGFERHPGGQSVSHTVPLLGCRGAVVRRSSFAPRISA